MYVLAECVESYCQARRGINEVGPETVSLQDRADLLRSIYKLDERWEIINQYLCTFGILCKETSPVLELAHQKDKYWTHFLFNSEYDQ